MDMMSNHPVGARCADTTSLHNTHLPHDHPLRGQVQIPGSASIMSGEVEPEVVYVIACGTVAGHCHVF